MTATLPTLSSQYEAKTTETKWQKFWEANEVFKAEPKQAGDYYSIVTQAHFSAMHSNPVDHAQHGESLRSHL